ncbi:nitroreductase family protein [Oceanivirga miroungae]|uniref:Nitroreductase n=1 Tax=Oceanivirga miroungae TaxID=1130046 RepID=A0A6I8MEC1_9FUSO|nr:nitroreductase family protein [Oceanivirga miroungae]VWL85817.1 nitroreductase [Oceanivirga miroungae]
MDVRKAILDRQSIRKFKDENVKDEDLKDILHLATRTPNAFNAQLTTILYTRDKEKIQEIAKLCGNQPQVASSNVFILLVTDLYKVKAVLDKKGLEMESNLDAMKQMAKIDAGIITYAINIASHNYGYGSTIIGGALRQPEEMKKLFKLPEHTEIAIGMTLGVPSLENSKTNTKPKLDIAMEDEYDKELVEKAYFGYDKDLDDWFKSIGVDHPLHTDIIAKIFSKKG